MKKINKLNRGFTLIEILIVMGIIAILAAIVLVAINPAKQFAQANDTQRLSNVNSILDAIGQYTIDNKGKIPSGITNTLKNIAKSGANICDDLVPVYIAALPVDPKSGNFKNCTDDYDTGYQVGTTTPNRIKIVAPQTESTTTIITVVR